MPTRAIMKQNAMTIIPICSIQHTGTWFAIELLRRHPAVADFHELPYVLFGEDHWRHAQHSTTPGILHVHLGDTKRSQRRPHLLSQLAWHLPFMFPTLIPLRDPMLSLITRHRRHPDLDHRYIVRAFERLAAYRRMCLPMQVTFLPVDLEFDRSGRVELIEKTLAFLGLDLTQEMIVYAHDWEPQNAGVGYKAHDLRIAYDQGDLGYVRAAMPKPFDLLISYRDLIKPFLEEQGYRDLKWWSWNQPKT